MEDRLVKVIFEPGGHQAEVPPQTSLLEAARQKDLPLEGPCNGRGTCGKCLVRATGNLSEPSQEEKNRLGSKLAEGWRLACQARVTGEARVFLGGQDDFRTISSGKSVNYRFAPPYLRYNPHPGPEGVYGMAIDIGTTSIVASLVSLGDGREISIASALNPQTTYGGDVITRITFAHEKPDNVAKLQSAVVGGINQLIEKICQEQKVGTSQLVHFTIAANTTMLHLLAGIDPISLAVAPYQPIFVDYRELRAEELGIKGGPGAVVSLLPSLSAFVGADILAGMIAIDYHREQGPALFIDIGTNGEIVANVHGRLVATSSATGPALEGMNIHHGCRAEDGAISRVRITGDGEVVFEKIGKARTKGICGSGLVDLVAELVRTGVVRPSGKFASPDELPQPLAERIIDYQGQKAFVVDPETMIVLTQKDIRQVQLAKGAIAAAIELLFKRLGVSLSMVKKVYIAGAFGFHLKPEALLTIGLLPPGLRADLEFVGNTAKEGARLCLVSQEALEAIKALQGRLEPLELSFEPDFQDNFVEQLDFPEAREGTHG